MIGLGANTFFLWMFVNWLVVIAHIIQPLDHVFSAIAPRRPRRASDAQMNPSSGQVQILCDLAARLSRATQEYFAGRQLLRVFVGGRMELVKIGRDTLRHA